MAYTIYNNDGSILVTLPDGTTDSLSTSITLVGRNVNSYGQIYNNNLIKMIGHFAGTSQPSNPIVGQLWYDTADGRIKVYSLNQRFTPITSVVSSPTIPKDLVANDFWFDSVNQQLYYSQAGFSAPALIAPKDSALYGNTGWVTETIQDIGLANHSVTKLYNADKLLGILSDKSFTLAVSTAGMTAVSVGLNLNTSIPGIRFVGTATSADAITGINVSNLVLNNINQTIAGELSIASNAGLSVIGSGNETVSLKIDNQAYTKTAAVLQYGSVNKPLIINVTGDNGTTSSIYIDSSNSSIGFWNRSPEYPLDVLGDTRIRGNLFVVGTLTNITSVNLELYEPVIELGFGQITPSDSVVDGGGIKLLGASDHTWLWANDGTGWNSNDKINLSDSSKAYSIGGVDLLYQDSLSSAITSAPGLTSIGTLTNLSVGNISMSGNTMTSTGNLVLKPTGHVSVNSGTIINVGYPVNNTDAANKQYVLDSFYLSHSNALSLTLDITNFTERYGNVFNGVSLFLNATFPISNTGTDAIFNLPTGTRAKVLCGTTYFTVPSTSTEVIINYAAQQIYAQQPGTFIYETFNVVNGDTGALRAYISTTTQFVPTTAYQLQTWYVEAGTWTQATIVAL
jgi:hypothetical protein